MTMGEADPSLSCDGLRKGGRGKVTMVEDSLWGLVTKLNADRRDILPYCMAEDEYVYLPNVCEARRLPNYLRNRYEKWAYRRTGSSRFYKMYNIHLGRYAKLRVIGKSINTS